MLWFIVMLACNTGEEGRLPASGEVWEPTTVPFDPSCARCEFIEVSGGHLGDVTFALDPAVDDPIAQYERCIFSITRCAEPDPTQLDRCVTAADCPQVCKDTYRDVGGGPEALLEVFLDGGVCDVSAEEAS
ncbi:MAG: hypothetical protein AAFV53_33060 [Myxococcota bacterium]